MGEVGCPAPCSRNSGGDCVCPTLDGGGTSGDGGPPCTVASACISAGSETCIEFPFNNSDVQASCTGEGGSYTTSPCGRTDAVGGCRQGSGVGCSTTWYYAASGLSVEDIQATCSSGAGVFVSL